MADVFNPTIGEGIGFESPVQQPSVFGAIGNLASSFLSAKPDTPKRPSAESMKDEARRGYFAEWDAGTQLINDGKEAEGKSRIRKAYSNWTSQYGPGDEDVDESFERSTGIAAGVENFNTASDDTEIMSTPDYALNVELVRKSNPGLDENQVTMAALNTTKQKMAIDGEIALIKQGKEVDWLKAQDVYQEKAKTLGRSVRDMVSMIEKDQIITPEEASNLRTWYRNERGSLEAPTGVSDTDWKSFEDTHLKSMDTIVGFAIGSLEHGGGSLDNDTKRALTQIINKAVVQGKLPTTILANLAPATNGDYKDAIQVLKDMSKEGGFSSKWLENVNSATNMSFDELLNWVTDFEDQDASIFDTGIDLSEFNKLKPTDKPSSITADTAMLRSKDLGKKALGVVQIAEKVAGLTSEQLSPEFLDKTFNGEYFRTVEEVYKANPVVGEAMINRTNAAISSQEAALILSMESTAAVYGWRVRKANGKYDFFPDDSLMRPDVKADLDKYFGGDWNKAIAAGGRAVVKGGSRATGSLAIDTQVAFALRAVTPLRERLNKFNTVVEKKDKLLELVPAEEVQPVSEQQSSDFDPSKIENIQFTSGEVPSGASQKDDVDFRLPPEVEGDTEFLHEVSNLARDINANDEDILRIISFESRFDPSIRNEAGSGATGLIQFMPSTAKSLGITTEELAGMTRGQQMYYVGKYFKNALAGTPNPNLGDLYMAVLWPKAIGKGDDYVLFEKGTKAYDQNAGLDVNGDGFVTRGDAVSKVFKSAPGRYFGPKLPEAGGAPLVSPRPASDLEFKRSERGAVESSPRPQPRPEGDRGSQGVKEASVQPSGEAVGASKSRTVIDQDIQALLDSLGDDESIQIYKSEAALKKAKEQGKVQKGDKVVVNGKVETV